MKVSNRLKSKMLTALIVLLVAFSSMVTATFAWYIYQTGARTTNVRMAVGTGMSLQISNKYEDGYGSAAVLEEFQGRLHPVSTDKIIGGTFQKVIGFTDGSENLSNLKANLFAKSEGNDFYKTSLFFRTTGERKKVYLSNIGFQDSDEDNPISTAIRIGFVVHETGKDQPEKQEFFFEITEKHNPQAKYNTYYGEEGHVLDSSKTDGSTVPFSKLHDSSNFCLYDNETGEVTLLPGSLPLFEVEGKSPLDFGDSVQVDVYIWLEGCDSDCIKNICGTSLKNLALSFACEREGEQTE